MFPSEVFLPEFIIMDLEAEDKDEVFEEMVAHFCSVVKTADREEILAALRKREAKMSTGVHPGVAIPHGETTAVDKAHGIFGISRKGIEYDALDGKPVHMVFMEIAPAVESEKHLHLLKRIAELLRNHEFYEECMGAKTINEVHNTIKKYEDTEQ